MRLSGVLPHLRAHSSYRWLRDAFSAAGRISLSVNVILGARPALLAALHADLRLPTLLVVPRSSSALRYHEELAAWSPRREDIALLPELEGLPYERVRQDPSVTAMRLRALQRLFSPCDGGSLVVASARSLIDKVMLPADLLANSLRLEIGRRQSPASLIDRLAAMGYQATPVAQTQGEYARRGGIVDLFPMQAHAPCRVEFYGDRVESIRLFDPADQRSREKLDAVEVLPAHEVLLPAASASPSARGQAVTQDLRSLDLQRCTSSVRHVFQQEVESLLDGREFPMLEFYRGYLGAASPLHYLPEEGLLVLHEPEKIASTVRSLEQQCQEALAELVPRGEIPQGFLRPYFTWEELERFLAGLPVSTLSLSHHPDHSRLSFELPPSFGGRLPAVLDLCSESVRASGRVVVVSQQVNRLSELLADEQVLVAPVDNVEETDGTSLSGLTLVHGSLSEGWLLRPDGIEAPFVAPEGAALAVLTDREIFGWSRASRQAPHKQAPARELFFSELAPGDYVVHVDHGIGRYRGLVKLAAGGSEQEHLLVEYGSGDRLYVPFEQASRLTRYVGPGDYEPALTRLGTGEWQRAKQRVRRSVRLLARELLELYAARELASGFAFSPDGPWHQELEASFPYDETPDQLKASAEVKQDMEKPKPMDRLLVGDVGYGKTEIALRAAFKAVMDGKQVAVLVPTTVLAQQHYNTFRERLQPFPVRVEMLSRFRSHQEQGEVVQGLRGGTVDICIGTHRLIQKDVQFKDLALVVIDEEQRFGVVHKERLKQLRKEVDVLTLSATPIPRTLHLSLVGVRDMSVVETPPEERLSIRTYVSQHDDALVREAILRELDRGGQVYYLHNRVQTIHAAAQRLGRLVPEAFITVAHGQMPDEELEKVMLEFAAGKHDVLVCTTIIESGLDIPNVNTIIVGDAHRFGLSQLHQLRGRVGRGGSRAYAYLLVPKDTPLGEEAEKRLRALVESSELGGGFRLAMRDLEIRGAGNILGAEQSGHITAVGFELYCQLLAEAVEEMSTAAGAPAPEARRRPLSAAASGVSIALPLPAYLPSEYVPEEGLRLNLYQRLASSSEDKELGKLLEEMEDRFGSMPEPAQNLAYVVSLKLAAARAGVREIAVEDREVVLRFREAPPPLPTALARREGQTMKVRFNELRFARGRGTGWLQQLRELVDALQPAHPSGQDLVSRVASG